MRILLVKLKHLGDTLLLTPTIAWLRETYPDARIDVVVRGGCEVVLKDNPDISRIVTVAAPEKGRRSLANAVREVWTITKSLLLRRYDYAVDLSDSDRAKFLIHLTRSRYKGINDAYGHLGWKGAGFKCRSTFKYANQPAVQRDFQTVSEVIGKSGEAGPAKFVSKVRLEDVIRRVGSALTRGNYVVVHATSRWRFKQWLPERWAEFADIVQRDYGMRIVFSCGPDITEQRHVREILDRTEKKHCWTAGRLTISEVGALISNAALFVGVDTLAMHLAATTRTPIIALFGPSRADIWRPWKAEHMLLEHGCICDERRQQTCPKDQPYKCMKSIILDDVLMAVDKYLPRSSS